MSLKKLIFMMSAAVAVLINHAMAVDYDKTERDYWFKTMGERIVTSTINTVDDLTGCLTAVQQDPIMISIRMAHYHCKSKE